MKVLHTIAGLSAASGGPSACTYNLLQYLQRTSIEAHLVTLKSGKQDLGNNEPWTTFLDNDFCTPVGFSGNLNKYLKSASVDIIHTNGLWLYCNHISAQVARKKNIPFVLTPHGMLIANAIKRHYWKKWILLKLWFREDIANAACLHATCQEEMEFIRAFGYKGPIAVIPNPTPPMKWIDSIIENHSLKRIGFLGRLHPVKNVDKLIKAWKQLGSKVADAELVLMGEGSPEYEKYLKGLAAECEYGHINFHGFINGKTKFQELANLNVLCLVSDFENFGMTVTEALSVGTPVIANITTPWEDLNTHHCGWWIDATVDNIAIAIEKALYLSDEEITAMGAHGKRLVSDKYAADKVAEKMAVLYQWLLEECSKPEFVYE